MLTMVRLFFLSVPDSVGDFRLLKNVFDTDISLISCSLSKEEHYRRTYPGLIQGYGDANHLPFVFVSRGFRASENRA